MDNSEDFIIQLLDSSRGTVDLEVKYACRDLNVLAEILNVDRREGGYLLGIYYLSLTQIAALRERLGVHLPSLQGIWRLHNIRLRGDLCYLPHGELDLELFFDGTKKLGFVHHSILSSLDVSEARHSREDEIDQNVLAGRLVKSVSIEQTKLGRPPHLTALKTIYISVPGEEWRISAYKLLKAAIKKTGTSELSERQLSALFGYEDWQTDCWINYQKRQRGSFSGCRIFFVLKASERDLLQTLGVRALSHLHEMPLLLSLTEELNLPSAEYNSLTQHRTEVILCRTSISPTMLTQLVRTEDDKTFSLCREDLSEFNASCRSYIERVKQYKI